MIYHLSPEVLDIIARQRATDAADISTHQHHASERQKLHRVVLLERQGRGELAEADARGDLFKEKHGHDHKGNATTTRSRNTGRLREADSRIAMAERMLAAHEAKTAQSPKKTADRMEADLAKLFREGRRNVAFESVPRPQLPLGKNERAMDARSRFTEQTLALHEEYRAITKGPRTHDEVRQAVHGEIDALADRGLVRSMPAFHGGKLDWPLQKLQSVRGSAHIPTVPDALAIMCFVFREEVKAKMDTMLASNAKVFPDALSMEEKTEALAALTLEIAAAERLEAACVEQIIAEGGEASHRPDADILAVLSLRIVDGEAADEDSE